MAFLGSGEAGLHEGEGGDGRRNIHLVSAGHLRRKVYAAGGVSPRSARGCPERGAEADPASKKRRGAMGSGDSNPLVPGNLYTSRKGAAALKSEDPAGQAGQAGAPSGGDQQHAELRRSFHEGRTAGSRLLAPAIFEQPIVMHSPQFYAISTAGGITSCGLTHTLVTPLDVIKCNMQTDPSKYRSIPSAFGTIFREQGMPGLIRGWFPTMLGYAAQGACKFGFYEFFKKQFADLAGPDAAHRYGTLLFLASSASAEFIADIALSPMEAVKVAVQTRSSYGIGLSDGFPRFVKENGYGGLFKGLTSLWARQIPYTMMKFACFERTVQLLYATVVPKPQYECTKPEKLGVSFAAGYIAGVFCAVVSHPADNLVSKLNADSRNTIGSVFREMGLTGLIFRGLPMRILMVGTLTGAQWGIYDSFKVATGALDNEIVMAPALQRFSCQMSIPSNSLMLLQGCPQLAEGGSRRRNGEKIDCDCNNVVIKMKKTAYECMLGIQTLTAKAEEVGD